MNARIISSECADAPIPEGTFPGYILRKMAGYGAKLAIIEAETGNSYTYRELCAAVAAMVTGFSAMAWEDVTSPRALVDQDASSRSSSVRQEFIARRGGRSCVTKTTDNLEESVSVLRGQVVLVVSRNHALYGPAFLALSSLGAVTSTANPASTEGELRAQLDDSGPVWIICGEPEAEKVQKSASYPGSPVQRILCFGEAEGCISVQSVISNAARSTVDPDKVTARDLDPDDVIYLPYSSGTTGKPKGVMHTHRSLLAQVIFINHPRWRFDLYPGEERYVLFHPMFHAFGLAIMFPSVLAGGDTLVLMERFSMPGYLTAIQEHRGTVLPLAPPVALLLSKHPDVDRYDLSSVHTAFCASAPLAENVSRHVTDRLNLRSFRQGYGMSECLINFISPADGWKHGSVGKVCVNTVAKVVDPSSGRGLGPHQLGEICMRGPSVMKGYFHCPQASRETLDKDGWLRSGDIGYYDESGNFYIVDRLKELIKYKGHQVAPAELESVLLRHPDVEDAAVVGLSDDLAGELPVAFVVFKTGSDVKCDTIIQFVKGHVSPEKWLRGGVRVVGSIPKSPSGKILRRLLRDSLHTDKHRTTSKL